MVATPIPSGALITSNGRLGPNVILFNESTFQVGWLGTLCVSNRNCGFARALILGTVSCDGRDRIATKAPAGLLLQR